MTVIDVKGTHTLNNLYFCKKLKMENAHGLSPLQLELLKIFSIPLEERQLLEIKELLSRYFAEQATGEMDRLWEERGWTNETMRKWAQEHMRTKS